MSPTLARGIVLVALGALTACTRSTSRSSPSTPVVDSLSQARSAMAAEVMRSIAGRENELATQVFKNVKALTFQVSAQQLVRAMDMGFGRSLGVSCDDCHIVGQWDSDSLRAKRIARSMIRLNGIINTEFSKMTDFPEPRGASCWTCHR